LTKKRKNEIYLKKQKKSFNKRKWHLLKQGSDEKIMLQKKKESLVPWHYSMERKKRKKPKTT
jgi:hypothetical protein